MRENSIWSLSKKVCWPSEISAGSPPAGFQKIISEVEAKCATFLKLRLGWNKWLLHRVDILGASCFASAPMLMLHVAERVSRVWWWTLLVLPDPAQPPSTPPNPEYTLWPKPHPPRQWRWWRQQCLWHPRRCRWWWCSGEFLPVCR